MTLQRCSNFPGGELWLTISFEFVKIGAAKLKRGGENSWVSLKLGVRIKITLEKYWVVFIILLKGCYKLLNLHSAIFLIVFAGF